jgi:hypothetical protein
LGGLRPYTSRVRKDRSARRSRHSIASAKWLHRPLATFQRQGGLVFASNPHTLNATTWGERQASDWVNIEIDQMGRYAARLIEAGRDEAARGSTVSVST